jgi:hypothetical protein
MRSKPRPHRTGRPRLQLKGRRFGELVVLCESPLSLKRTRHTDWLCRCDCGEKVTVRGALLTDGTSRRCRKCSSKASVEARARNREIVRKNARNLVRAGEPIPLVW